MVSGATATQQDGCEPTAKEPVVFHKQIIGEQKRLHVIPDPIMQKKSETFSISVRYKNINGPSKGVYYRHALGKSKVQTCVQAMYGVIQNRMSLFIPDPEQGPSFYIFKILKSLRRLSVHHHVVVHYLKQFRLRP